MNTFEIMRLIGEAPSHFMNGTETAILMRIALIANRSGNAASPGVQKLIDTTKFCRRLILKNLKSLTDKKILMECSGRVKGSKIKSEYKINIELLKGKIIDSSSAPRAPDSSAPHALEKSKNSGSLVHHMHLSSAPRALALVHHVHQTPYIQPIKPIKPKNNVELGANSTSLSSQKKSSKKSKKEKKNFVGEIDDIFRHWQKELNHSRAKLDKKRRGIILRSLEDGYSVEDLKKSIDGVKKTPWNMGDNDRGEAYNDFHVIFRNSSQIERFIRNFDTPPTPKNKNVSTASKSAFFENRKKSSEMMKELTEKLFPKENLSKQSTKKESEIELKTIK